MESTSNCCYKYKNIGSNKLKLYLAINILVCLCTLCFVIFLYLNAVSKVNYFKYKNIDYLNSFKNTDNFISNDHNENNGFQRDLVVLANHDGYRLRRDADRWNEENCHEEESESLKHLKSDSKYFVNLNLNEIPDKIQEYCENVGLTLAEIRHVDDSISIDLQLYEVFNEVNGKAYPLGVRDDRKGAEFYGEWTYKDENPMTYSNWASYNVKGETNNETEGERCAAAVLENGKHSRGPESYWLDVKCDAQGKKSRDFFAVCQFPKDHICFGQSIEEEKNEYRSIDLSFVQQIENRKYYFSNQQTTMPKANKICIQYGFYLFDFPSLDVVKPFLAVHSHNMWCMKRPAHTFLWTSGELKDSSNKEAGWTWLSQQNTSFDAEKNKNEFTWSIDIDPSKRKNNKCLVLTSGNDDELKKPYVQATQCDQPNFFYCYSDETSVIIPTTPRSRKNKSPKDFDVVTPTPEEISTDDPEEVSTDDPEEVSTDEPEEVSTDDPEEISTDDPEEVSTDEPEEISTDEPEEISTDDPEEVSTDEPEEVSTDDPSEISTDEPLEISTDDPEEVSTDDPEEVSTDDPEEVSTDDPEQVSTDEPEEVSTDDPEEVSTDEPEEVSTDDPEKVSTDDPEEVSTDDPSEISTDEPSETSTDDPEEVSTDDPEEVSTDDPEEVSTDEPEEVSTDDPDEVSTDEPEEISTDEPEEIATDDPEEVSTDDPEETSTDDPSEISTDDPEEVATEDPEKVSTDDPEEISTDDPSPLPKNNTLTPRFGIITVPDYDDEKH